MTSQIPAKAFVEVRAMRDGAYVLVGRVRLADGKVAVEGEPSFVAELEEGFDHPALGKRITPADGYLFLVTVSNRFQSPYLIASGVQAD